MKNKIIDFCYKALTLPISMYNNHEPNRPNMNRKGVVSPVIFNNPNTKELNMKFSDSFTKGDNRLPLFKSLFTAYKWHLTWIKERKWHAFDGMIIHIAIVKVKSFKKK